MKHESGNLVFYLALVVVLGGSDASAGSPYQATRVVSQGETAKSAKLTADVSDEAPPSQDVEGRSFRLAKNIRYNTDGPDLTKLAPEEHIVNQTWPRTDFIPVSQSSIVILGSVSQMQPHLSENRSQIYTEITILAQTVFKDKTKNLCLPGTRVLIDMPGGNLRLSSGRIVRDETKTEFLGKPYVGGRFVFFARTIHDGKDLTLIRGYELRDGRVFELNDDGAPGRKLIPTTAGIGADLSREDAFLQSVRKRAAE